MPLMPTKVIVIILLSDPLTREFTMFQYHCMRERERDHMC